MLLQSLDILLVIFCLVFFIPSIFTNQDPYVPNSEIITLVFAIDIVVAVPWILKYSLDYLYQNILQKTPYASRNPTIFFGGALLLIDVIYFSSRSSDKLLASLCACRRFTVLYFLLSLLSQHITNFAKTLILNHAAIITFASIQVFSLLAKGREKTISYSVYIILGLFFSGIIVWFIFSFVKQIVLDDGIIFKKKSVQKEKARRNLLVTICTIICVYTIYSCWSNQFLSYSKVLFEFDSLITIIVPVFVNHLHTYIVKFDSAIQQTKELKMMKSTLARYLSHQIRTPLNSVVLGLTCLNQLISKNRPHDHEMLELIRDAFQSSVVINSILENIITYENLSTGTFKIYPKNIKANDMVKSLLEPWYLQAAEKRIKFIVECHVDEGINLQKTYIHIDQIRMEKVINTLISNAFKYSKRSGEVTLSINYRISNQTGRTRFDDLVHYGDGNNIGFLSISVADKGRGIVKESLDDLLEKTIHFETGREEEQQGSGLSLWIAHRLVKLHHNCQLQVCSEGKDLGSTFTLTIPIQYVLFDPTEGVVANAVAQAHNNFSPLSFARSRSHDQVANTTRIARGFQNFTHLPFADNYSARSLGRPLALRSKPTVGSPLSPGSQIPRSSDQVRVFCEDEQTIPFEMMDVTRNVMQQLTVSTGEDEKIIDTPITSKASIDEIGKPQQGICKVLVVDDAPINRKMVVRIINDCCQHIEQAEDGAVAVNLLQNSINTGYPFDFILMDYQMPNMDGATAAKVMREIGYKGPIIGITGNAVTRDIQTYLANGANAVLTKPLNIKQLNEHLSGLGVVLNSMDFQL